YHLGVTDILRSDLRFVAPPLDGQGEPDRNGRATNSSGDIPLPSHQSPDRHCFLSSRRRLYKPGTCLPSATDQLGRLVGALWAIASQASATRPALSRPIATLTHALALPTLCPKLLKAS